MKNMVLNIILITIFYSSFLQSKPLSIKEQSELSSMPTKTDVAILATAVSSHPSDKKIEEYCKNQKSLFNIFLANIGLVLPIPINVCDKYKKIHKNINGSDEKDIFSLLDFAILSNDIEAVKILADHPNIDINKCPKDLSPLECAIYTNNIKAVKILVDHPNIDINQRGNDGLSPLERAIYNNNIKAVKILLDHPNIDINQCDNNGLSSLKRAIYNNNIEIITILREHGAQ